MINFHRAGLLHVLGSCFGPNLRWVASVREHRDAHLGEAETIVLIETCSLRAGFSGTPRDDGRC